MNHLDTMKQALEALEYLQGIVDTERGPKAAAALRLAIEQAEKAEPDPCKEGSCDCCWTEKAEPVGWQYREANHDGTWTAWVGCDKRLTESTWRGVRPLYTAPPQRQPDQLSGMSEMNRIVAYCAANKLRELSYEWDGKDWQAPPQQQTQEPIAWGYVDRHGMIIDCITPEEHARAEGSYNVPLYTAPRQRQPLTDAEIEAMWQQSCREHFNGLQREIHLARAIEAAHGIGGDK